MPQQDQRLVLHSDPRKRTRKSIANDQAYQDSLVERSSKRRRNDFDRYIEIPNDHRIDDSLSWWREHQEDYPHLAKMARDVLAVPASGCTIERVFSISGRLCTWQRNNFHPDTISLTMLYKYAMAKTSNPLPTSDDHDDGDHEYPVAEMEGEVPEEWVLNWWWSKMEEAPVGKVSRENMFNPGLSETGSEEDDEDLYG